jgi:hypothetical protein
MMKDVIEDEKQQTRWNHYQTTIERVDEAKVMPWDEARNAHQK